VNLTAIRERAAVELVRRAPKRMYVAAIGWGARRTVPRFLREPMYAAFASAVGARVDEAELPLDDYATFGDFFARGLRAGARTIAPEADAVISPCDGTVAASGTISGGRLIQAKGRDYTVRELVADSDLADRLEGGTYVTIYLSPRDYHRVHAPVDAAISGYEYVPGALLPVNRLFSRQVDRLLAKNERVVLRLAPEPEGAGQMALVMVAATGVGNMRLEHVDLWSVDLRPRGRRHGQQLADAPRVERGDELGAFHLGSTVVLLCEPGALQLESIPADTPVRFGEPIGRNQAASGRRQRRVSE
jgi:phosphatidylserine decarboxylase